MSSPRYAELDPFPVAQTATLLARRIEERFPGSGLGKVAAELVRVADQNQQVIEQLRRPVWWLRGLTVIAIVALVALTGAAAVALLRFAKAGSESLVDFLQGIEAATNVLILLALAIFFLVSLETRLKRRKALATLHRLRSMAHVVDMHQLTKDPEHARHSVEGTPSSPVRTLTGPQLARYLDYCSELLAIMSKLAALHAQHLQDPVVLDAVNDIETLTSDLSRKIWQKITILDAARP
jgi:hypothetical protein